MNQPLILPDENKPAVDLSKEGMIKRAIKNRQYKVMLLDTQFLLELLNSKRTIYTNIEGIPKDVLILGVNYDPVRDMFLMRLVSTEFPAVKQGTVIPFIEGEVTVKDCTCKKNN